MMHVNLTDLDAILSPEGASTSKQHNLAPRRFKSLDGVRLGLLGKRVAAECPEAVHRGHLRAIAFDGLELALADGRLLRLTPETVRHLGAE